MFYYHIKNFFLRLRYKFFKRLAKKVSFDNRVLLLSDNFETLQNFTMIDNDFYSNNEVWFSKDAIRLTGEGVELLCYKDVAEHTNWSGTYQSLYTAGMISSRDTFLYPNGVWVINACICDSFCAAWLLKKDRHEPGYERVQITPEIDIMENIKGKMTQTIHWGYEEEPIYRKYGIGSPIFGADNEYHEYAVELLKDGYKFYVDGVLTAIFRTNNPEFVTDYPNFLLLNNAMNKYSKNKDFTVFKVKSVKVYQ